MTVSRGAAIAGGVALLAAWLAAAAGVRRSVSQVSIEPGASPRPTPRSLVADLLGEGERLAQRLPVAPLPQQPSRNPFEFASRVPPAPTPVGESADLPKPGLFPLTPLPALRLIGVAEDGTADGPKRTAILSGMDQLFLAAEGEEIAGRFRVVAIGAEAVELQDRQGGSTFRLALR